MDAQRDLRNKVLDLIRIVQDVLEVSESEIYKFLDNYSFLYGAYGLLSNMLRYKVTPDILESHITHLITREQIIAKHIKPSSRVFDIGCGTGYFGVILATKKCNYVGIDKDEKKIEIAKKIANIFNISHGYNVLNIDMTKVDRLPFNDKSFDYVTAIWTIHEIEPKDQEQCFAEINRILKDGGKILLYDRIHILHDEKIRNTIVRNGFKKEKEITFGPVLSHKQKDIVVLAIYRKKSSA